MTREDFKALYFSEVTCLQDSLDAVRECGEHDAVGAYLDGILALQRVYCRIMSEVNFDEV